MYYYNSISGRFHENVKTCTNKVPAIIKYPILGVSSVIAVALAVGAIAYRALLYFVSLFTYQFRGYQNWSIENGKKLETSFKKEIEYISTMISCCTKPDNRFGYNGSASPSPERNDYGVRSTYTNSRSPNQDHIFFPTQSYFSSLSTLSNTRNGVNSNTSSSYSASSGPLNRARSSYSEGDTEAVSFSLVAIDSNLGKKCLEIPHTIDWSKDCKDFDPTYTFNILSTRNKYVDIRISFLDQVLGNKEPFWANNYLDEKNKINFAKFLIGMTQFDETGSADLGNNMQELNQIVDGIMYKRMSNQNLERLRQMIYLIMNRLNNKSTEEQAVVINQICEAIKNCSNRINVEIERIAYQLSQPKSTNIEKDVKLALMNMRVIILEKAIRKIVQDDSYYSQHEAASFNYYYRIMSKALGLPESISSLDKNYQTYALQNKESEIGDIFTNEYNAKNLIDKIHRIVNDNFDPEISCQLFTDWVMSRYKEQMNDMIDDEGIYKRETVIRLLKEIGVLAQFYQESDS